MADPAHPAPQKTENVIEDFLQQPEETMRSIYRQHREVFFGWARNHTPFNEDDLADLFQECVIIFCQNVRKQRLTELTSSVRTYLFGIAKNLIQAKLRTNDRMSFPGEENLIFPLDFDLGAESQMIEHEEIERITRAIGQLSQPCQQILKLTYFEQMKSAAIATILKYSSEEVVRVQRKRCLDKLRNIFK